MKAFFILFFILVASSVYAQFPTLQQGTRNTGAQGNISNNKVADFVRPPIEDYKIISIKSDTITVDTSLTIAKDYKFNYLRKDRYGLLPFANTGQTHNTLVYHFDKQSTLPNSVAQSRHFNYLGVEDIKYYYLPTPVTELYFRSAFEQGQQLDAFFTMNTSPRLNFSVAYKGLRSLGKYQNALTSTGNFRLAGSYRTKNNRYRINAHWVAQDLLNQENGGLQEQAIEQFTSNDDQFNDRSRLLVNFQDAENILDGTRVYVKHHYKLIGKKDSIADYALKIGHVFNSENKFYEYRQNAANAIFGDAFQQSNFRDRTDNEETYNELYAEYNDKNLGTLTFQANTTYYNYGYNSVLIQDVDNDGIEERIPNRLQGTIIAVGGGYKNTIGKINIEGTAQVNVTGDFDGFNVFGRASYDIAPDKTFSASILSNSRPAAYNHLLYQSNYINYNWHNAPTYENVQTNTLAARLEANKWINIDASASTISNYAYFGIDETDGFVNSFQTDETINHLKVTANREVTVGKFGLDATVTFQNVSGAEGILNTPDILTRGSLYFTDRLFKRALFLQTGFTVQYFTEYNLNSYDPVLAEFYVQNNQEIGGFPLIDFFVNMKVRQTRIFFKAEHLNSGFTGNDFFSAPGYPYRDFNVRFGIVWNFFL
ncbi:putative porin [uncultured Dokdonia sp.]|uniref:putative porin n=1 Tax=uncultured Dokdonia sp. TaxID=575653 RepID=UPI0026106D41|nr:putative porin [uncultured Dokdonia sp.]